MHPIHAQKQLNPPPKKRQKRFDSYIPSVLQHLGPSALAGIATVILIFPLNGFIAKKRSKLQVKAVTGILRTLVAVAQTSGTSGQGCHSWFR